MEERLDSDPLEETTDQLRESSDEQLEEPISSQGGDTSQERANLTMMFETLKKNWKIVQRHSKSQ